MIECISVSNDYDMADMKFIYHRGLPFSCDNCAIDEKESMRVRGNMIAVGCIKVRIKSRSVIRFNQSD